MIKEKLLNIQQNLKVNKGQFNKFGGYKYRSCEDILEAVKPLLQKNKVILTLTDDLVQVGERYYIKATAILRDLEDDTQIENTAFARESETKKGMDDSQITGTASSYARKYALNGLFCIDDTKDADTNEYQEQTHPVETEIDPNTKISVNEAKALQMSINNNNIAQDFVENLLNKYGYKTIQDIAIKDYRKIIDEFKKIK